MANGKFLFIVLVVVGSWFHCFALSTDQIPPETNYMVMLNVTSAYHPANKQPEDRNIQNVTTLLATAYDPPFTTCDHARMEIKQTNFIKSFTSNISKLSLTFLVIPNDKKKKVEAYYCAENALQRTSEISKQLHDLLMFRKGMMTELEFSIDQKSCCEEQHVHIDPCCQKGFTLKNDTCVIIQLKPDEPNKEVEVRKMEKDTKEKCGPILSLGMIIITTSGSVVFLVAVVLTTTYVWKRKHRRGGQYEIPDNAEPSVEIMNINATPNPTTDAVPDENREGYMKMKASRNTNPGESADNSRASSVSNKPGSRPISRSEMLFNFNKHIPITAIEFTDTILGRGQFGLVELANVTINGETTKCAVKMIRGRGTHEDERELFEELQMLYQIPDHPNVVSLLGGCMEIDSPLYVVVEYCANGSLLKFLHKYRNCQEYINIKSPTLDFWWKINRGIEICEGMAFLAYKQIIHRDLAARNILLDENEVAKISDFGMAKDVYLRGLYVKETAGFLPVRWMAIEAIEASMYTIKSDMWSFGVLLWELYMDGRSPYPAIQDGHKLLSYLEKGYRMDQPENCPDAFYQLMERCWLKKPDDRPAFSQALRELQMIKESEMRRESATSRETELTEIPVFDEPEEAYGDKTFSHSMNDLGIVNRGRRSSNSDIELVHMRETNESSSC